MEPSSEQQGERIIPPTRRPDGTMRKAVRIRAGYVPQEEVAIYQSKGALIKKSMPLVPPGYDPDTAAASNKPKTKSAKKNEKRKEKKLQAREAETREAETVAQVEALTQQVDSLEVSDSKAAELTTPENNNGETGGKSELEKRIRALRKKIRLAQESSSSPQLAKIEAWQDELKQLELQTS